MARYMLLIYGDQAKWQDVTPEEQGVMMHEYFALTQAMIDAGVMRAGDPLEAAPTAQTVGKGGAVTDGPFAEVAEHLAGYYIVEVDQQADAVKWAKQMPGVERGLDRIEVREIRELPAEAPGRPETAQAGR